MFFDLFSRVMRFYFDKFPTTKICHLYLLPLSLYTRAMYINLNLLLSRQNTEIATQGLWGRWDDLVCVTGDGETEREEFGAPSSLRGSIPKAMSQSNEVFYF